MSGPLAESRGASRRFGDFLAVDAVDLRVQPGEVVGLLGANGAGKTTLIRLLLGLLAVSGGEVLLFDRPPSRETRRRMGYVPQGLGLYDDLTATENLAFARAAFGGEERADRPPAGIRLDVPVGRLPLGEQRRVAFAQALAHTPDLLVLDEPTSGVDPLARARLWETIREAADRGAGTLVTTHHMDEAQECDRLVVMAAGRAVAEGSVAGIVGGTRVVVVETTEWTRAFDALEQARVPAALVGRTLRVPDLSMAQVGAVLEGIDAHLADAPATLEERFLQLTALGGGGGVTGGGG